MPLFLEYALDPTFLFCLAAIFAPVLANRDHLTRKETVAYFSDPLLLLFIVLIPLLGGVGHVLRSRFLKEQERRKSIQDSVKTLHAYQRVNYRYLMRPLRLGERIRSRWYLLNGLIIHAYLDGAIGFFKWNRLLAASYGRIDRRYAATVGTYQGSVVHVLSLTECTVMAPLCVLLYLAFKVRHPMRDPLELVVCVVQAFGTVMYLGQEVISGGRNLDLDYFFTMSQHYVIFFWFPIVFGSVLFLVVPIYLAHRSFQRLANQVTFYQRHHYTRHTLDHVSPPPLPAAGAPPPLPALKAA